MFHIEMNDAGNGARLTEDCGPNHRVTVRYFDDRPTALRALERMVSAQSREVGRLKDGLEEAEQKLDYITASLEGERP